MLLGFVSLVVSFVVAPAATAAAAAASGGGLSSKIRDCHRGLHGPSSALGLGPPRPAARRRGRPRAHLARARLRARGGPPLMDEATSFKARYGATCAWLHRRPLDARGRLGCREAHNTGRLLVAVPLGFQLPSESNDSPLHASLMREHASDGRRRGIFFFVASTLDLLKA